MSVFNDRFPVYLQIVHDFRRRIASGEMTCGQKFPSVRELSEQLQVNPNTVVHAYRELELLGLTETRRGMGTFVTGSDTTVRRLKKEEGRQLVTDFISALKQTGLSDPEIREMVRTELEKRSVSANGGTTGEYS
ncbi:MAG: GntR family transcriptional regulator [Treponema sp.]|jgi:GntR family transcriptional regulator|nr:GntR family transcriptional regulator [Treponema sp.]